MSRFIGLTDSKDGKTMFFNVDNIVKIQADTGVRGVPGTGIWLSNKSRADVHVDESVYCVLWLINESSSNCERSEKLIKALERCDTYLRKVLRSETMPTLDEIRAALIENDKLLAGSREV